MAYKIFLTALVLFLLYNSSYKERNEEFVPLNPIIEVGENFYVQHDVNNNKIYDVKKSGTSVTNCCNNLLHEATTSEAFKPIPGEQYFTKCFEVGYVKCIYGFQGFTLQQIVNLIN